MEAARLNFSTSIRPAKLARDAEHVCRCRQPSCQGAWQVGCGLGLVDLIDDAVYDVEVVPEPAADRDELVHDLTEQVDAHALRVLANEREALLLRAASALAPYRRRSTSLLGENEAAKAFSDIVEHLGDACPQELQVLLLPRA